MIDPRELRVGNLIWILHEDWEEEKAITTRHLIDLQHHIEFPDDERYSRGGPKDYIAAIPLTAKWLERFGFKQFTPMSNVWWSIQIGDTEILDITIWPTCVELLYLDKRLPKDPQYVHQLQNLYFALTGKELELKS